MCWYSISIAVCPPTAPLVAVATPILLYRASPRRLKHLLFGWALGLLPLAYLLVWGGKVAEWIFD
jgi:hypothetical protein